MQIHISPVGLRDVRTGCPERQLEPTEYPSKMYEICDVCGEPIMNGTDCYDMPDSICIHEDCLWDYARQFKHFWYE